MKSDERSRRTRPFPWRVIALSALVGASIWFYFIEPGDLPLTFGEAPLPDAPLAARGDVSCSGDVGDHLDEWAAERRGRISGRIRHKADESPAAGLLVRADRISKIKIFGEDTFGESRTDSNGAYCIDDLPIESCYRVGIVEMPEGFFLLETPRVDLAGDGDCRRVDLWIARYGSISGAVRAKKVSYAPETLEHAVSAITDLSPRRDAQLAIEDAIGRFMSLSEEPLIGVAVTITRTGFLSGPSIESRIMTDGTGVYSLGELRPDEYWIQVDPLERAPRLRKDDRLVFRKIMLESGEAAKVDFLLHGESVTMTGRVVDQDGCPISGVDISACSVADLDLLNDELYGDLRVPQPLLTTTDARGEYALSGMLPASFDQAREFILQGRCFREMYAISAQADGYAPVRLLAPPLTRILDESTRSFCESLYRVAPKLGVDPRERATMTPSAGVPRPRFSQDALVLPDIALLRSAIISGEAADRRGRKLARARIRMVPAGGSSNKLEALKSLPVAPDWAATDADGAFEIGGLSPGEYFFEVTTENGGTQRAINPPVAFRVGERVGRYRVIVPESELAE